MKHKQIILLFIFVLLTFAACEEKVVVPNLLESGIQNDHFIKKEESLRGIAIRTPITISSTPIAHSDLVMRIRMVEGEYYEDWHLGPYMGLNYEGQFVIEISNPMNEIVTLTSINAFYQDDSLHFNGHFELVFDDYNNDGQPDFLLGQRFNSNGYTYKIFSINRAYEVIEIPVAGHSELFIADSRYSTTLSREEDGTLSYEYYDQQHGHKRNRLKWQDELFILVRE